MRSSEVADSSDVADETRAIVIDGLNHVFVQFRDRMTRLGKRLVMDRGTRHSRDSACPGPWGFLVMVAGLVLVGLLLGGCGSSARKVLPLRLAWHACAPSQGPTGPGFQCATLRVPIDTAHPGGPTLRLALARHLATGKPIGSLLVNPGGPGASAVNFVQGGVDPALSLRFDIIGFDPPGVGRSDPVTCLEGSALGHYLAVDPNPSGRDGVVRLLAADRRFARACRAHSASILAHTSTVDAARDMDLVRRALGERKLTYLGYSYGTLLGATYAEMYGARVRAMVLDGAVNPSVGLDSLAYARQQAVGYDSQFRRFAAFCRHSALCPWRPAGDPVIAFLALEQKLRAHPLHVPASASIPQADPGLVRTVGPAALLTATESWLLDDSLGWPALGKMLESAQRGNGAPALTIFNETNQQTSPASVAAVQCLDGPAPTPAQYAATARTLKANAPFDVPGLAVNGQLQCSMWPVAPTGHPHQINAPNAPPILVVGSTHDPATPYYDAQAMASQLTHAVLLTRDGDGHTAYGFSACIRATVDAYLTRLTLPPKGKTCPSNK